MAWRRKKRQRPFLYQGRPTTSRHPCSAERTILHRARLTGSKATLAWVDQDLGGADPGGSVGGLLGGWIRGLFR